MLKKNPEVFGEPATPRLLMLDSPGAGKTLLAHHLSEPINYRTLDRSYWA